jgi:cytochrome c oxidase subunit I+III
VAILLLVAGSLFLSYFFSYLYLWTVYPDAWPPENAPRASTSIALPAGLLIVGSACAYGASHALRRSATFPFAILVVLALGAVALSPAIDAADHWQAGLRPNASGYAAMVFLYHFLQFQITAAVLMAGGFGLARLAGGKLDRRRRAAFDVLTLLIHYAVAQGLVGLVLIRGFPEVAVP